MRVLGIDPSLTNLGYVVLEDGKVLEKGRFQTSPEDGLNVQRYLIQSNRVSEIIEKYKIKYVSSESPIFQDFNTEVLYGLQSFLHLVYWVHAVNVVILSPLQVKSYALPNFKGKIFKSDMVKAARKDMGLADNSRLANDVADAYWISKIGLRWWMFYEKLITEKDLTVKENQMFLHSHTFTRGKKQGQTEKKGIVFRKNEIYYIYEELKKPIFLFKGN
jgi:Holliday junction resolvasome RuvABC endonuclease subunit